MKLVNCDVPPEELEEAMRQLEEDERWQAAHPARQTLIEALDNAITFLEGLKNDLRDK